MTLDEQVRLGFDHRGLIALRFPAEAFSLEPELLGALAFLAAVSDGSGRIHPVCAARARSDWPYVIDALIAGNWLGEGPHGGLYLTWVATVRPDPSDMRFDVSSGVRAAVKNMDFGFQFNPAAQAEEADRD